MVVFFSIVHSRWLELTSVRRFHSRKWGKKKKKKGKTGPGISRLPTEVLILPVFRFKLG